MNKSICALIILLTTLYGSQKTGMLSGLVMTQKNYKPLENTQVIILNSKQGTVTDEQGKFDMILETGKHRVKVQMAGYQTDTLRIEIKFGKTSFYEIFLQQKDYQAPKIIKVADMNKFMHQPLETNIDLKYKMHSLLELDPIKKVTMQPGVNYIDDYSTALFIRGSKSYQSLISYNDVPLLNSSHSGGFFSMFNGASVDKVEFSPAIYSVQQSGYLGGRVNIVPAYNRDDRFNNQVFIGLSSSGFYHTSDSSHYNYFIAGRRTYIDIFTGAVLLLSGMDIGKRVPYWFDDLQAGFEYNFNEYNNLEISGLYSRDHFNYKLGERAKSSWKNPNWGNNVIGIKYNYTKYPFNFQVHTFGTSCINQAKLDYMNIDNVAKYYGSNLDLEYSFGKNKINLGLGYRVKAFDYNIKISEPPDDRNDMRDMVDWFYNYTQDTINYKEENNIPSLYLQYKQYLSKNMSVNTGINFRYNSLFNKNILSPQIQVNNNIKDNLKIALTLAKHYQSEYTLQNLTDRESENFSPFATQPTYYFVTDEDRLLTSDYISLGGNYYSKYFIIKSELYYKSMENIPELNQQNSIDLQKISSYGLDLSITGTYKKIQEFNIAYSLCSINVKENQISYPANYERLHQVKLNCSYKISNSWTMTTRGIYLSGLPYTPKKIIIGAGPGPDQDRNIWPLFSNYYYGSLGVWKGTTNSVRFPPYYRLDLGFSKKWMQYKHRLTVEFFLYNLLTIKNPLYFTCELSNTEVEKSTYLNMPIIPSIKVIYEF